MKIRSSLLCGAAALFLFVPPAVKAEDFYIRIELLRGVSAPAEAVPSGWTVSMYPMWSFVMPGPAGDPSNLAPAQGTREDLLQIYKLNEVARLTESMLVWDEVESRLPGIIMVERETFRLEVEPKYVPPKRMRLRVLLARVKNKAGALERILDTNLVAELDDAVVSGFNYRGQPYFLSLRVTRTRPETGRGAAGAPGARAEARSATPVPIHRVAPKAPESVEPARVEGEVVLRVSVDEEGRVTDVQILKSLQPDVDRATIQAVREWTFEPVREKGGARPATFAMSFRFRKTPWELLAGPDMDAPEEPQDRPGPTAPEPALTAPGELKGILEACAGYCRKLSGAALDFVCEEKISEEIYDYVPTYDPNSLNFELSALKRMTQKASFLYDFQMVRSPEGIREDRTLLEENGKMTREPHAPLKTKRFFSYRSLYGPVGLFSRERWPLFDYRLSGQDKVRGKRAWVVEVRPKAGAEPEVIFGRAWVDQETFQIFRLEVDAESLAGYEKAAEALDLSRVTPVFTTVHFYEVEKNGLLFPSRTSFREAFSVSGGRRIQRSRTDVSYTNYRFFTVDTETVVKD